MTAESSLKINGMFLEPVNRVLWRIITGKAIDAGPKLSMLTDHIRELFSMVERGTIAQVLQMTTSWGANLFKLLGMWNVIDVAHNFQGFMQSEMQQGTPDPDGNFIDRYLSDMQKASSSSRYDKAKSNTVSFSSVT